MSRTKPLVALLSSLFLVACSTGSGNGDDDDDDSVDSGIVLFADANTTVHPDANTTVHPDANTTVHPDASTAWSCTADQNNTGPASTQGDYACWSGSAWQACGSSDPADADDVEILGLLNDDTTPDVLLIDLFPDYGAFSSGLVTGTFNLADEGNYKDCGACITVKTDMNTSTYATVDDYYQTAGTLTITSITPGSPATISGSVSGLTLTHVTIDSSTSTSTAVGDGCDIAVGDFSFTTEVSDYSGS